MSAASDTQLRRDPVMGRLIDDFGGPLPVEPDSRGRPEDLYGSLVRTIAGQQLSVRAAAAIWRKVLERFGGEVPTPQQILDDDPDELRTSCGFSRAKITYLRSLAEHVLSGQLELDHLQTLSDDEVIAELTAVKGIGVWSAHMFLMWTLHRPDVLAPGDLGIRNAFTAAYGEDADLVQQAEQWRPYRTRACLYLWRSMQTTPT